MRLWVYAQSYTEGRQKHTAASSAACCEAERSQQDGPPGGPLLPPGPHIPLQTGYLHAHKHLDTMQTSISATLRCGALRPFTPTRQQQRLATAPSSSMRSVRCSATEESSKPAAEAVPQQQPSTAVPPPPAPQPPREQVGQPAFSAAGEALELSVVLLPIRFKVMWWLR